jgi:hypothetical protein
MKYILFLLLLAVSGCAEMHHQPALGTQVRRINIKGQDLVHCSIMVDPHQAQFAHEAIEVCRAGISEMPQPVSSSH